MPSHLPICLGISIAWQIYSLANYGLTPDVMLALDNDFRDVDEEFAAALAVAYRETPGAWLTTPVKWKLGEATGYYWMHIDHAALGCADAWDPFPTRSEAVVALQRWAITKSLQESFFGRNMLVTTGIAMEAYEVAMGVADELHPETPSNLYDLTEMMLLSMSARYRYKTGYKLNGGNFGLVVPDPDSTGEKTWEDVAAKFD